MADIHSQYFFLAGLLIFISLKFEVVIGLVFQFEADKREPTYSQVWIFQF
jgi:hypothetical protein